MHTGAVSSLNIGDETMANRLLRGFYESHGDWRWAARLSAVSLDPPVTQSPTFVELDFNYPPEVADEYPTATVLARVNGVEVCRQSYGEGRHSLSCHVPEPALKKRPAEVEIESDKSVGRTEDNREQALIIVSIGLVEYEQTAEYRELQTRRAHQAYEKVLEAHRKEVPPEQAREMMRLFHKLPVWDSLWYQNVRIIKNPLDLWMMQQIIYEIQPDYVIETGTWAGGSALYWASVLHALGLEKSRVITLDVAYYHQAAETNFLWKKYVEFIHGSSTDPQIVAQLAKRVRGRKVIVTLDSDHHTPHVLKEIQSYAPMVSRGSYLVVEDTHMDGVPTYPDAGAGPMAAVRQFLDEGGSKDFEQDFAREALIMTFNPGGWLRRK